jgi:hypothetical protein
VNSGHRRFPRLDRPVGLRKSTSGQNRARAVHNGLAAPIFATDETFTDKEGQKHERVEWHQIVAFGKLAETCNQYLKKGGRFLSKEGSARGSSRSRATAASANARRSSHRAYSFSVPQRKDLRWATSRNRSRRPRTLRSNRLHRETPRP